MYTGSSTEALFNTISSSTNRGEDFISTVLNIPFQIFNAYINYIILVAVFGAAIAIGFALWRRWI